MSDERIAYVYPSPYTTGDDGKINAEPPTLAYRVSKFPCVFDICANIGMAYLQKGFQYKIDTRLYFGDDDLTDKITESVLQNHASHSTIDGNYVASFSTVIEGININEAGRYRLKCSLARTPIDGGMTVPVHEQECCFVISDKWTY